MSSLNIELVHIILHAVSMKTVGTAKHASDYRVYHDYDHLSKNEFVMDSIEIEDRDKWDISQVTQDLSIRRLSSLKGGMDEQVQRKLIINEDIRVIEYSPDVFAFLRARDGFNNDILRESLDPEVNKSSVFRAGEGSGKSGSFFFFSADANFIIKTMTNSDFKAFQRIQKAYFTRVCNDEHSLLARIYGIYSVFMEDKEPVTLVVMGNTMKKAERHLGVFDLKGSMIKRIVKGPITSKKTTLKDRNLLNMNREKLWLNFKEEDRKRILKSMRSDVEMLRKFNLMDYSLLLCIQENPNYEEAVKQKLSASHAKSWFNPELVNLGNSISKSGSMMGKSMRQEIQDGLQARFEHDKVGSRHKFISANGKYIYHLGIIDYLGDYNLSKKFETQAKVPYYGKGISAIPPQPYAVRFVKFMEEEVIIDQFALKNMTSTTSA